MRHKKEGLYEIYMFNMYLNDRVPKKMTHFMLFRVGGGGEYLLLNKQLNDYFTMRQNGQLYNRKIITLADK